MTVKLPTAEKLLRAYERLERLRERLSEYRGDSVSLDRQIEKAQAEIDHLQTTLDGEYI
jgi:uncharacterized coiled-coil DUF342 family protein